MTLQDQAHKVDTSRTTNRRQRLAFALTFVAVFCLPFRAAAADALEISTIGTSITAKNRYQQVVQRTLEGCGFASVNVSNYGKAGETSAWGVQNVMRAVERKPDILIVEFAINDALRDRNISPEESKKLTRQLISDVRNASPSTKVYLLTTNDPVGNAAARRPNLSQYYDQYRQLAREEGVGLIDTEGLWAKLGERALRDGLHPSNEGHVKVIAPAVVGALAPNCR